MTGDPFGGMPLRGRVAFGRRPSQQQGAQLGDGLTPEHRRRLTVCMSVSLSIVVRERQEAVVLPPQAIRTENGQHVACMRDGARFASRPVTLGITLPEGVEIHEGISPGDAIVLRE
ncbi:efflux RND transporter periplasmic adaptor subunit [Sabulicella glaciei]|uniref:CzcB-like C-terminal circularly permuted SH3-like domain-containing protein n=1 Tax=Sabulicella glaciei TaxID=2984948 RepID=A0ABT3NZM4_9PROT|nr:hypothetical protein [Roseococcus sp. MDT2-1-1]MCW8087617.1 hypothetical protein [Roseococcus sp. MDT2-1-1]